MFPFDYAENEYRLLKEQLATGGITQQRFDVAVKNLIFTDAQGRFWRLGPNDGKWYVNDGQTWVEAQPPVMDIGAGQMKSTQPPSIPPWDPNSRYRQKNYNFNLDDVVGWSEFRVLLTLGRPDEIRKGEEWNAGDPPPSMTVVTRDLFGEISKGISYEPVPHRIPPLQPYQSWFYHNVRGMMWKLYLTRRSRIPVISWFLPRIVVEVYQYPTGAVF